MLSSDKGLFPDALHHRIEGQAFIGYTHTCRHPSISYRGKKLKGMSEDVSSISYLREPELH